MTRSKLATKMLPGFGHVSPNCCTWAALTTCFQTMQVKHPGASPCSDRRVASLSALNLQRPYLDRHQRLQILSSSSPSEGYLVPYRRRAGGDTPDNW
jgi:hypothetical protein